MEPTDAQPDPNPDASSSCSKPLERGSSTSTSRLEHFIPVRKADLISRLTACPLLPAEEQQNFVNLCRMLEATIHYQFHQQFERLKDAYAPFDPDDATVTADPGKTDADARLMRALFERFQALLERANYVQLDRQQILEAMDATSEWGVRLDVELDLFDRLEVFVRGDTVGCRERRRLRNFYRREEVEVALYQRLAMIFRLREHARLESDISPDTVYVKLFKNIPKQDVDMLLPGSRVKMTVIDKSRILLPTVSGVALSIYKIVQLALTVAASTVAGLFAILGAVGGFIGYGVKSFFGFIRTKDKYQHNLTRSLYYQNLDNNAGVLFRLMDEAEEQEFREAILAYFVLWRKATGEAWTMLEIDEAAESMLWDLAGVRVDFEVDDAMDKLKRFGIVECHGDARFSAVSVTEALRRLDAAWDDCFQYHQPAGPS